MGVIDRNGFYSCELSVIRVKGITRYDLWRMNTFSNDMLLYETYFGKKYVKDSIILQKFL